MKKKCLNAILMVGVLGLALTACNKSTPSKTETGNIPTKTSDLVPTETNTSTNITSSADESTLNLLEAKVYNEGAYFKWNLENNDSVNNYEVSYSTNDKNYTKIDKELIRNENGIARADVLGLKAGNYTFMVKNINTGASSKYKAEINPDDRSGYAHFKNTDGIGAYNNDGTLKDNAIVVYVNDENKNTVKATINGNEETGLVNIIKAAKNTNESLDVRILGEIQTQQWNTKSHGTGKTAERMNNLNELFKDVDWEETTANELKHPDTAASKNYYKICEEDIIKYGINSMSDDAAKGITHLDGLTNNILKDINASDSGYQEYDSYYNELDVRGGNNITIEGIGDNAKIFQWGFCFNQCNSIEVKNIEFSAYTEDAIGIQGSNSDISLYSNYWIHNCTFNSGVNNWDVCYENDKKEGDGSTDFKSAHNLTISYCRYNGTHKTALVGSGDSSFQYNITFHHNYYNKCGSRLPFTRNSNFHIYNCYYNSSTGTNMQIYTNAYAFIERCYFSNTNKTFTTSNGGTIKLYKNIINATSAVTGTNIVYASDRTQIVANSCKADQTTDYSKFDTSSTLFYFNSEKNLSDVSFITEADNLDTYIPTVAGAGLNANIDFSSTLTEDDNIPEPVVGVDRVEDIPTEAGVYGRILSYELDSNNKAITSTEHDVEYTSNNVVTYNNDVLTLTDTSNTETTLAYYIFDESYTTGTHTYSLTLKTGTNVGSKWSLIQFLDENDGLAVRSCGLTTEAKNKWGYAITSDTESYSDLAVEKNKEYTIVLTINYDSSTASLKINDTTIEITNWTISQIKGIKFMTAITAADRSFEISNIEIK